MFIRTVRSGSTHNVPVVINTDHIIRIEPRANRLDQTTVYLLPGTQQEMSIIHVFVSFEDMWRVIKDTDAYMSIVNGDQS